MEHTVKIMSMSELDLRDELDLFFDGTDFGTTKYNVFIQRKARTANGVKIKCGSCWNPVSQEGRIGCADCDGVGYLWDEIPIYGYMWRPNYIRLGDEGTHYKPVAQAQNKGMTLITPTQFILRDEEVIIVPRVRENGTIYMPLEVDEKFVITAAQKIRLDHNRIEYNIASLIEV